MATSNWESKWLSNSVNIWPSDYVLPCAWKGAKVAWSCRGSNPRPSKCESDALPLSYNPTLWALEWIRGVSVFGHLKSFVWNPCIFYHDITNSILIALLCSASMRLPLFIWCVACSTVSTRLCGATVARLTPVQKAACSNHVRVKGKSFSPPLAILQMAKY